MRLDLLLERESFSEIFESTMAHYLKVENNWSGDITWNDKSNKKNSYLYVQPYLNVIYPENFPQQSLLELVEEYAFHPKLWRRILQNLYIRMATLRQGRNLFSSLIVKISPWTPQLDGWCILPGNHAIRIIDIQKNECIVISKKDFDIEFMRAQIKIRRSFPGLPIPKMIYFNDVEGWYREERVIGLPLNRVGDMNIRHQGLEKAQTAMITLYEKTKEVIDASGWGLRIVEEIKVRLVNLPRVYQDIHFKKKIQSVLELLTYKVSVFYGDKSGHRISIETVLSHGDFQAANILIDKKTDLHDIFIIDWEYVDRRCCWYDAFVYEFNARSPKGLADRIKLYIDQPELQSNLLSWCGCDRINLGSFMGVTTLFFLEDLLLRLKETMIPGLKIKSTGLVYLLDEIQKLERLCQ